jgi:hypothetical protein
MSTDENVFRALTDMGIDSVLARAAAQRFTHVEPAINWCFGDGANVSHFHSLTRIVAYI